MKAYWTLGALLLASALLVGCGGGGGGGGGTNTNFGVAIKALLNVPNVNAATNFSFDISAVDSAKGRMYFTDRNNKSVDVIDIKTNSFLKQITGDSRGATRARAASVRTTTCRVPMASTSSREPTSST